MQSFSFNAALFISMYQVSLLSRVKLITSLCLRAIITVSSDIINLSLLLRALRGSFPQTLMHTFSCLFTSSKLSCCFCRMWSKPQTDVSSQDEWPALPGSQRISSSSDPSSAPSSLTRDDTPVRSEDGVIIVGDALQFVLTVNCLLRS